MNRYYLKIKRFIGFKTLIGCFFNIFKIPTGMHNKLENFWGIPSMYPAMKQFSYLQNVVHLTQKGNLVNVLILKVPRNFHSMYSL